MDSVDGLDDGCSRSRTEDPDIGITNRKHFKKTDIKADGILCLTFTNSGAKAMKERLDHI